MSCTVRKTKGKQWGSCPIIYLGKTREREYNWCQDCGIVIQLYRAHSQVMIPQFDNQGDKFA